MIFRFLEYNNFSFYIYIYIYVHRKLKTYMRNSLAFKKSVLLVNNKLFYEDLINILRAASNKLLTTPHDYKQNFLWSHMHVFFIAIILVDLNVLKICKNHKNSRELKWIKWVYFREKCGKHQTSK